MVGRWRGNAARLLTSEMHAFSPEQAIERKVQQLLHQAGSGDVPTDLLAVASACHIQNIVSSELREDGYLLSLPTGTEIFVNAQQTLGRQRFTAAHEIVHTLIPEVDRGHPRFEEENLFREDGDEVERLCDIGAAELLVPLAGLRNRIANVFPSLDCVGRLASIYEVSLEVMARQISRAGSWRCIFVLWEPGKRKSEDGRIDQLPLPLLDLIGVDRDADPLRVKRSFVSAGLDLRVKINKSVCRESSVARCLEARSHRSGREVFELFYEGEKEFDVESEFVPYSVRDGNSYRLVPRVLSLLIPPKTMDEAVSYE
jgi:Zn-dependent peptidase ImmA (M78 family)